MGVFWTLLGRLWNALGRLLGTSWVSWAPLERFFGSWEGLGGGFGGVLEGDWASKRRLLGRFRIGLWEGSNNFWGGIWKGLGISRSQFGSCLVFPWVSRSFGTPAMSRSAYTIRGGSHTPTRVGFEVSL